MIGFLRYIGRRPKALAVTIAVNVVVTATLFGVVEHHNVIEGAWWTIVTGSTTGYGDFYPKSNLGRFIASYFIISMLVLMVLVQSQVNAWLVHDPHVFTDEEQKRLESKIDKLLQLSEQSLEWDILCKCVPKPSTITRNGWEKTTTPSTKRLLGAGTSVLKNAVCTILSTLKLKSG